MSWLNLRRVPVRSSLVAVPFVLVLCLSLTAKPHYDMDVVVDFAHGTFHGSVTVSYPNRTGVDLDAVFFRLLGNDSGIYGGSLVSVSEVLVQTASESYQLFCEDMVLMIPMVPALRDGEETVFHIAFRGEAANWIDPSSFPQREGYGLLTRSESALTLSAFYPLLAVFGTEGWALNPSPGFGDVIMAETSDYTVRLTTDRGITAITSGVQVERLDENQQTMYTFTAQNVREFSAVLVDDAYRIQAVQAGETLIQTAFRAKYAAAADRSLDLVAESLELYERLIGPFPYPQISVVEVPTGVVAGMEFSGLLLVGAEYAAAPDSRFFSIIISHEMAHQWFYAGVGNDVSEHPWLDEAFATYFSYVFLDEVVSPLAAAAEFRMARASYEAARRARPDLCITSPTYAFPDVWTYAAFVYNGGAALLRWIHDAVGADCFYQAIQDYYRTSLFSIAGPCDFLRSLACACDRAIGELLEEFGVQPSWNLCSCSVYVEQE